MQGSIIVSAGDSTSSLADRLGVSNRELIEANPHKEHRRLGDGRWVFVDLIEGETLRIPWRVAHQFPLQAFPSLGAALPQLGSILPPSTVPNTNNSGCKPGEVQLAPGVCIPNATAPLPQTGCPSGTMELMGQCVPDPRTLGKSPPTVSGCPEGQILLAGQCFPDPRSLGGTKATPQCPPGTMYDIAGLCIPQTNGGNPPPSGGGCPPGMMSVMGQCVPDPWSNPNAAPTPPNCPPGSILLWGQCFPDPRTQFKGTPPASQQGGCPANTYPIYPGICVPLGGSGGEKQGPPQCPAGSQELVPGLCIPNGVPTGKEQGVCGPGRIEILPGVCIPDPKSNGGVPASNVPPTRQECLDSYGPNYFPYQDPVSGLWGCGVCPTEHEVPAADGLCYCKQGMVRQNPMDPYSPCVPPSSQTQQPQNFVPQTKEERDEYCQRTYGLNSKSVLLNGEWFCNVCRPDERITDDNTCVCLSGTSRAIDGDPDSACIPKPVPQQPAAEKEEKKDKEDNTGLIIAGVATGALLLLGVGILAGRTSSPPPALRARPCLLYTSPSPRDS